MRCPHCAAENPEDNRFCSECGRPLAVDAVELPPLQEIAPPRASGKCPPRAVLLLLLAGIVAPLIVGGVYHLVARFIDLLILFPFVAGAGTGMALAIAVGRGKCRNPAVTIVFALIAGVMTYGTRWYLDSQHRRPDMVAAFSEALATEQKLPPAEARAALERYLDPIRTLRVYLELTAEAGISIGRRSSSISRRGGITLQGPLFWLLLLAETGIVVGVAIVFSKGAASGAFCEKCEVWESESTLFRVHPSQSDALLENVRAQAWEEIGNLPVGGEVSDKIHCDMVITRCDKCADTRVTVRSKGGGGKRRLFHARLAPESVARLVRLGRAAEEQSEAGSSPDAPGA